MVSLFHSLTRGFAFIELGIGFTRTRKKWNLWLRGIQSLVSSDSDQNILRRFKQCKPQSKLSFFKTGRDVTVEK